MNFNRRVYEVVSRIPCGRVATYGQIAFLVGSPRASRAVGRALHMNPTPIVVPCHRVVNRNGRLAPSFGFGGPEEQRRLLEAEGVQVGEEGVELCRYLWRPEEAVSPQEP